MTETPTQTGQGTMLEQMARAAANDEDARVIAGKEDAADFDNMDPEVRMYWRTIALAVLKVLRNPTLEMVGRVVQQVGDPAPEDWELAERTVESLGYVSMDGERACAELVRDFRNMLDSISPIKESE